MKRLLSMFTTGLTAVGPSVALTGPADAASALGASAAERGGRYFGAAVAAGELGDATYVNLLKMNRSTS
ncbi:hypothetical protein FAF44_26295 [Nonomuraea sp. MG754425]|uniref:hypothetical protein n=1 Tax=Nonomuraea sp. MG754425 TaxID=2570319 RepID=UPI001F445D1C|nr:hypothetical protein [Nonomuraea sp. MG754425]MCF6471875.1 hypothetical protein [Nonomuraea sp. MG754425]